MDGKSVVCVVTNRTIGPLTVRENSPICELSCVRSDFKFAVLRQQQDKLASPESSVSSCPDPLPPRPPPPPPPTPGPPPRRPRRPPPEKQFKKKKQKKNKQTNLISEIVPRNSPCHIREFASDEDEDDDDDEDENIMMPGLLPAGQVGPLEDSDSEKRRYIEGGGLVTRRTVAVTVTVTFLV